MIDSRRDFIQSIERCFAVIVAFSSGEPHKTLSEIAVIARLSKPTVRRILLTLEQLGYVQRLERRFGLTPKVLGLGYAYLSSLNLTEIAHPLMEKLTDQVRQGTSLGVLDGTDVVYVNLVHRYRITSINLAVGTRLPAHATSMGHVLLADLGPDQLKKYVAQATLDALTDRTLTSKKALAKRLEIVRTRGWDAVDQELESGRRSAAAPIRDASGQVIAALALSCGTSECTFQQVIDEYVPPLRHTADQISAALGGGRYAPRKRAAEPATEPPERDR